MDNKKFNPRRPNDKNKSKFSNRSPTKSENFASISKPGSVSGAQKKPFDKKKWREQKYSLKYKVQNWEDKRKKAILRQYYKGEQEEEKSGNKKKFDVKKIYEEHGDEEEEDTEGVRHEVPQQITEIEEENDDNKGTPKGKAFRKAHLEFLRIKQEKQRKREDFLKKKAEKEEARKEYKKKKTEKYKKLNQKTKKGQPIMKNRLEDLLEKIQKSVSSES